MLLQFYSINPSIANVNLLLAKTFIDRGNSDIGLQLITRVYSASHSEEGRLRLAELRDRVNDKDFVVDSIDEMLASFR